MAAAHSFEESVLSESMHVLNFVNKNAVFITYGCPQGHALHLEIEPHIDTMTWGPGTLVI